MRNSHWRISLRSTAVPQRSQRPRITSSFANPVLHDGHQLIGTVPSYANPCLNSSRKIHCVHLTYSGLVVLISRFQSYAKPMLSICLRKLLMASAVMMLG